MNELINYKEVLLEISNKYKSNGNLVSLRVDMSEFRMLAQSDTINYISYLSSTSELEDKDGLFHEIGGNLWIGYPQKVGSQPKVSGGRAATVNVGSSRGFDLNREYVNPRVSLGSVPLNLDMSFYPSAPLDGYTPVEESQDANGNIIPGDVYFHTLYFRVEFRKIK